MFVKNVFVNFLASGIKSTWQMGTDRRLNYLHYHQIQENKTKPNVTSAENLRGKCLHWALEILVY